jgi:hypothetical protein
MGMATVRCLNLVRVISLFQLGQWSDTAFRFAHKYPRQRLIMLDVLAVWPFWVRMNPDQLPGRPADGA